MFAYEQQKIWVKNNFILIFQDKKSNKVKLILIAMQIIRL